jgi:transposase InsO family protein
MHGQHSNCVKQHCGSHLKVLIRDRDRKYGPLFSSVATCSGIQEVKTPYRAPKANVVGERFMGSMRRECLDHTFVLNQRHLERVVKEYRGYYNDARPHQGIQQRIPGRYGKRNTHHQGNCLCRTEWPSSRLFAHGISELNSLSGLIADRAMTALHGILQAVR